MNKETDLRTKLKLAHPLLKKYVAELEKENSRLQSQVARYEAKQLSVQNRVSALEKELKENRPQVSLNINRVGHELTHSEMVQRLTKAGYKVEQP